MYRSLQKAKIIMTGIANLLGLCGDGENGNAMLEGILGKKRQRENEKTSKCYFKYFENYQ